MEWEGWSGGVGVGGLEWGGWSGGGGVGGGSACASPLTDGPSQPLQLLLLLMEGALLHFCLQNLLLLHLQLTLLLQLPIPEGETLPT